MRYKSPVKKIETNNSQRLEDYLLDWENNAPASETVISELHHERAIKRSFSSISGLMVITADGRENLHTYSGGAGSGGNMLPKNEVIKLRQGYAVFLPEDHDPDPKRRVRIFCTKKEAEGFLVLMGS